MLKINAIQVFLRKIFILMLFCCIVLSSLAKGYEIKIKIKGLKDTVLYLANYYGDKQYMRDTAQRDKSGYFVFKGDIPLEGGIYIVAGQAKIRYFECIVNTDFAMTFETDTADFVDNMKIKGSAENIAFYDYMRFLDNQYQRVEPLQKKMMQYRKSQPDSVKVINQQIADVHDAVKKYQDNLFEKYPEYFLSKFLKAQQELEIPDPPKKADGTIDSGFQYRYFKQHYWDNLDVADERFLRSPIFHNKLKEYFTRVVIQIPDTICKEADALIAKARPNKEMFKYIVWYVTNWSETSNIMGFDAIFVHMVDHYYAKKEAYWVTETVLENIVKRANELRYTLLGKKAPDLFMVDTSFAPVRMYDVQCEYLVLLFYEPDCGHCKTEVPKLKKLLDSADNKQIKVFAVYIDAKIEEWKKFVKQQKLDWINVINGYNIPFRDWYDVKSTPVLFILDENKEIIAKRIGANQVLDVINDWERIKKRKQKK